jgi:hypothetical protein
VPLIATGDTLEVGTPEVLFLTRIVGGGIEIAQGRHYSVAPDGHFLIQSVVGNDNDPITLIQNWNPEAAQ